MCYLYKYTNMQKGSYKMEFENILKLIKSVSESSLSSFTLEEGDTKITLEANRGNSSPVTITTSVEGNKSCGNGLPTFSPMLGQSNNETKVGSAIESNLEIQGNIVKSPLVGVFYSSSSPEIDAFVKVGDKVSVGQTLGIVEAMKLMNEIECDYDGIVKQILINNEDIVEYGQPLFVIA